MMRHPPEYTRERLNVFLIKYFIDGFPTEGDSNIVEEEEARFRHLGRCEFDPVLSALANEADQYGA
jgi:hypothetical protein